jgi:uncharacterized protein
MTEREVMTKLGLRPLPNEGGFHRETYRSDDTLARSALPPRYSSDRRLSTAIYYLLTPDSFSAMHRIKSDEIYHFYQGGPATMLQLHPDGHGEVLVLGSDLAAGHLCQCLVPRGVWQGLFLNSGADYALMGTTVSPGFEFADFELGDRRALVEGYPQYEALITRLTRG